LGWGLGWVWKKKPKPKPALGFELDWTESKDEGQQSSINASKECERRRRDDKAAGFQPDWEIFT